MLQQELASEGLFQKRGVAICTETASFYASGIIKAIMGDLQVSGRESFALIYKELMGAVFEVGTVHGLCRSDMGSVALGMTSLEASDVQFDLTLYYFENDKSRLLVSSADIDQYAENCNREILKLLPDYVGAACLIIRVARLVKIDQLATADKRQLGAEVVSRITLRKATSLDNAVFALLDRGIGDRPLSELNTGDLIRKDMTALSELSEE